MEILKKKRKKTNVETNVKKIKKINEEIAPPDFPSFRLTENMNTCQNYKVNCRTQNMIIDGAGGTGKNRNLIDPNIRLLNHNFLVLEWSKEIYEEHKKRLFENGYQTLAIEIQDMNKEKIAEIANNLIKQPRYAAFIFVPITDINNESYGYLINLLYKKILSVTYEIDGMPDFHPHIQIYIDDLMELLLQIPYFHRILQLCKNHNIGTFMTMKGTLRYVHNTMFKNLLYVCDFFLFMGTNEPDEAENIAKILNINNWKEILVMPNEECLLQIKGKGIFRDKKIRL